MPARLLALARRFAQLAPASSINLSFAQRQGRERPTRFGGDKMNVNAPNFRQFSIGIIRNVLGTITRYQTYHCTSCLPATCSTKTPGCQAHHPSENVAASLMSLDVSGFPPSRLRLEASGTVGPGFNGKLHALAPVYAAGVCSSPLQLRRDLDSAPPVREHGRRDGPIRGGSLPPSPCSPTTSRAPASAPHCSSKVKQHFPPGAVLWSAIRYVRTRSSRALSNRRFEDSSQAAPNSHTMAIAKHLRIMIPTHLSIPSLEQRGFFGPPKSSGCRWGGRSMGHLLQARRLQGRPAHVDECPGPLR